ncbi:MAG: excinuclease ABC subunit A [Legionellales bacterium]|nr:excinuclease ABC subunit A [Legionellales bacterium]
MDTIAIRGARTHNLKSIDCDLPRDKLIVITGLSGSGKSSLAFDTLYAEGQRRYVESLSAYARQFLSLMDKPDVDHIEGLSPAISIEQKTTSHNPRSTVGTITEIYDYLRLLYARAGEPRCPKHDLPLAAQTVSQMTDAVLALPEDTAILLLAPVVRGRKGEHKQLFERLQASGYIRARVDGEVVELDDIPPLDPKKAHHVEVVVDRLKVRANAQTRIADSFETTLQLGDGLAYVKGMHDDSIDMTFSSRYACQECGYSIEELEPRLFSFNNPAGACPECDGLGVMEYFSPELVVRQPSLTLASGAIAGWDRRNPYYFRMLEDVAEHYGFDLKTPFEALSEEHQNILLHGSKNSEIAFRGLHDKAEVIRRKPFEGVIPMLARRYRDTDSEAVRDELSQYISTSACNACDGQRIKEQARNVFIVNRNLPSLTAQPIGDLFTFFETIELEGTQAQIAEKIIKEIKHRLHFLVDIGLSYLTLSRSADTLSGGEAQRIRLASQIGAGLVGVMYVLDEPSIGLHQRDNEKLLGTLKRLRDLGNTVIVVEHDEDAIMAADHVLDIGPRAGSGGGSIVAEGTPSEVMNSNSLTGQYLSGKKSIQLSTKPKEPTDKWIKVIGATGNNLQNIEVALPVGLFTCVTGVSGSGKSTLINHTLFPHAAHRLNRASLVQASPCEGIEGLEHLDKVININQSPIGRTPRSNAATYTGLLTPIRSIFSETNEARTRGYKPGRFSFNVRGGRCEACQGDGLIKVEMHFLSDVYVICDVCQGKRYNRETLEIYYKEKSIHDVLEMTVDDAFEFFDAIPAIKNKLKTLQDVGLGYLKLGQSATTLSGGEAQRIKLSKELSRRDTGKTLYILDEPTTGLHFHDVQQLLEVLDSLRDKGNTIVVIEHNLDVIKTADWIVDLGPEGGSGGGQLIVEGTPQQVAKEQHSFTGQFLKKLLDNKAKKKS